MQCTTLTLSLPRCPQAVATARHAVRGLAAADPNLRDRVAPAVTETVANAVRHTQGGSVELIAGTDSAGLFVAVFDEDPAAAPRPRPGFELL
ncbi:ATP-binding protein [Streptomyces sp. NPDC056883]|uniref:ATP-binding protein n=1 Tax=Streptomyces sp. NPDC056883 TaxID=3345959 RepID=UPI0036C773DA